LRKLVAFQMDDRLLKRTDAICEQIDCSRSAFLRRCINYYLGMSELEMTAVDRKLIKQIDRDLQQAATDEPFIPEHIKSQPNFDRELYLKYRA
jgi:predicted transcriptional regulator